MTRRAPHVALAALAALGSSACEGIEISESAYVRLLDAPDGTLETTTFRTRLVGRLGLDFAVRNVGTETASFGVLAQALTRGSPADEVCDAFRVGSGITTTAASGEAAPPRLRSLRAAYDITLPPDPALPGRFRGRVLFPVTRQSRWNVYIEAQDPIVTASAADGTPVPPDDLTLPENACGRITSARSFALADGVWNLDLDAAGPRARVLVDEDCRERRRVPRTCPGTDSDVIRYDRDLTLAPGQEQIGRLTRTEVGIGDEVIVAFECIAGPCDGELVVSMDARSLVCTTNDACASDETCSEDGYCVPRDVPASCAVSTRTSPAWLILLLLAWRRTRARRG